MRGKKKIWQGIAGSREVEKKLENKGSGAGTSARRQETGALNSQGLSNKNPLEPTCAAIKKFTSSDESKPEKKLEASVSLDVDTDTDVRASKQSRRRRSSPMQDEVSDVTGSSDVGLGDGESVSDQL